MARCGQETKTLTKSQVSFTGRLCWTFDGKGGDFIAHSFF